MSDTFVVTETPVGRISLLKEDFESVARHLLRNGSPRLGLWTLRFLDTAPVSEAGRVTADFHPETARAYVNAARAIGLYY